MACACACVCTVRSVCRALFRSECALCASQDYQTPLHLAKDEGSCRVLVDARADVNAKDKVPCGVGYGVRLTTHA